MADTTALKNRIRAAIKANDNQEITGPVLQQALLDIVDELNGATETEADARQNADSQLQTNINNEATTRSNADTQLNNLITGIKNNIDNGYVYAGIATPLTTPVSGKVFYMAAQAGTYTNFDNKVLTHGINILRFNGSAWSNQQLIAIDDEPTSGNDNLVKSEGIIKYVNRLFINKENSNNLDYWSLIKEIYITNENIDSTCVIKLVNVARSVSGNWYVLFQVTKNGSTSNYNIYVHSEPSGLQQIINFGYLILDWTNIPNNVQAPLDITLNNKIFDINFSPSIKSALNKADINAIKVVNDTKCGKIPGHYVYTSNTNGSVPSGFEVGKKITTSIASSFNIISIPVVSGQKFYIPRYGNRNTLNPVLVDDDDIILQVFDITTYTYPDDFVKIDDFYYFEVTVEYNGYLVYSDSIDSTHGIRSNYPSVKAHNPYPFINTTNSQQYLNFVKECYIEDTSGSNRTFFIGNIARNVNGNWYIQFGIEDSEEQFSVSLHSDVEYIVVTGPDVKVHLIVDWNAFPSEQQTYTRIEFNKNAFDFSKTNLIKIYYTKSQINSVIGQEVNQLNTKIESSKSEYKTIAIWNAANLPGYANTSDTDGTPRGTVGQKVTYIAESSDFKHVRVQVNKGEIVYVPYIEGNYTIKNPYLVNKYEVLLQIGDITQIQQSDLVYFEGDSQPHWPFVPESNGYLIMCRNSDFKIYSNISTVRQTKSPEEESETIIPVIGTESLVPFDFEVAKTMNHTMLKSIIESSSNGACTVIYDNNGYPNLMFKIPLMTIGALAPTLGDLETPHPAFVVNGITKRHIYAAVFMNSEYNGVPVSWFGLGTSMRSKSFLQCRTLCAAKGTGWHLETIWERSLISLLSAKYHDNRPRGNNCWGRSRATGFEYECVERVDGHYPGSQQNGCQWYDGTQPNTWSHNNSRWGIFDIVGGYHEWCNLAKVVDGQIFLAADNKYNAEESEWVATGAYIGFDNDKVKYSNVQYPVVELKTGAWSDALCDSGYDSLSLDIRKKLALSLMCPRLSSEDNQPVFDFNGRIWVRRNDEEGYTTYPFLGGAEEYSDCGLGFNILSYVGTEAHNNMGSRLFYID